MKIILPNMGENQSRILLGVDDFVLCFSHFAPCHSMNKRCSSVNSSHHVKGV